MDNRRVVITGLGIISSIGIGKDNFWEASLKGASGVGPIKGLDASRFRTRMAAEVHDFSPTDYMDKLLESKIDRFSQFAISTSKMAHDDSKLDLSKEDPYRAGVILGSGLGGMFFYEKQILEMLDKSQSRVHPNAIPRCMPNAPTGQVAIAMNLKGPNLTVSTACSSGNHAIGIAYNFIQQGTADVMFAGGTEAPIVYFNYAGFDALRVMSKNNESPQEACKPFDKNRDGFVMGEGAAVLVIEELNHALDRNAHIYGEIIGYSLTCGAEHLVIPVTNGEDARRTMAYALRNAQVSFKDIDYINAHGTSTQANDKAETQAIKDVFEDRAYKIPVSSTKSMVGHTFGASGAIEAVTCSLVMEHNIVPPTINYKVPDPECDLDYVPNEARAHRVNRILSNSFAFGGNNSCLIFGRYND